MRQLVLFIAFNFILASPIVSLWNIANATPQNPNLFPLGAREVFTGNAGAGHMGSLGGVYYNPASLVALRKSQFSANTSTVTQKSQKIEKAIQISSNDIAIETRDLSIVPTSAITSIKTSNMVWAFSLLVPIETTTNTLTTVEINNTDVDFSQINQFSEIWLGVSAANYLSKEVAIGLSLFALRTQSFSNSYARAYNPVASNSLFSLFSFTNAEIFNFLATIGLMYDAGENWNLGLRIQSPTFRIASQGELIIGSDVFTAGTRSPTSVTRETGLKTDYQLPWDLTFGTSIWPSKSIELLVDVSFQTSNSYDVILNPPSAVFENTIATESTFRYNLGSAITISKNSKLALGFNYNPSAQEVLQKEREYKEDYYGITTGYLYESNKINYGVGLYYLWSSGQRVTQQSLEVAPMNSKFLGALLSASFPF